MEIGLAKNIHCMTNDKVQNANSQYLVIFVTIYLIFMLLHNATWNDVLWVKDAHITVIKVGLHSVSLAYC